MVAEIVDALDIKKVKVNNSTYKLEQYEAVVLEKLNQFGVL
jgi:hypothetical protein